MANLSSRYMGLDLANPFLVGSSGLTRTLDGVVRCAKAGAGGIVLKSIFEEEIQAEVSELMDATSPVPWHHEAEEYLERYGREDAVGDYLQLIRDARRETAIPVIASINCVTAEGWGEFASRVEQAGAQALELNVFVLPSDVRRDAAANEKVVFDVAATVTRAVSIPVALKVGPYFSGLARTLTALSKTGIQGLVLFNRFYQVDIDPETLELVPGNLYSSPEEIHLPLRWISILHGRAMCDLAATTGVHDGLGAAKLLLAGASAVQVCSVLYRREVEYLATMIADLGAWMDRHEFAGIADFKGRLDQKRIENPAAYERVQFMKETSGHPIG